MQSSAYFQVIQLNDISRFTCIQGFETSCTFYYYDVRNSGKRPNGLAITSQRKRAQLLEERDTSESNSDTEHSDTDNDEIEGIFLNWKIIKKFK